MAEKPSEFPENQEIRKMVRSDRGERPVSEDEYESMPERISDHFDQVRDLLAEETGDSDT